MEIKMKLKSEFFVAMATIAMILIGCGENKNEKSIDESIDKLNGENKVIKIVLPSDVRSKIDLSINEVKEGTINGTLKVPAKLITNQDYEAQVGSLVPSIVHQVFVKEGDFIKTGQVLMLVKGLEIGEIIEAYLKAESNLDYYKAAFERQKALLEQNIGSQKAFLEAKAEYEKALAEYNAEEKRIHSIGLEHSDLKTNMDSEHTPGLLPVKSPISGIVTERNVVIGQFIEANTIAFKIMNIFNLWAEGQIYEKDLTKISSMPKIEFTTPAYPNVKFKGEVILIGQTVDEHTRTIKVRASLQNIDGKLKPNMFGELFIPISSNIKGVTMPTEALVSEGNKRYVFLVENDSTFVKHYVETGTEFNGFVEITSGLKKGDKIVTKGVFFLKSELLKETFGEEE
jgi:cobalt-zinc-cadmium efflux system membrane fusion protein